MWLKSFITWAGHENKFITPKGIFTLQSDQMCDGWSNVWSKGFITLAGHEKKFINPEGDEK